MAIPALAILAASAFLKYQNDRAALKRQQRLSNAMQTFQRRRSDEAMAATEGLVAKQTPEARSTELADLTAAREQSMRDSVGAVQGFNAPQLAGKTSADYRAASESEAFARAERTRRAIEQLAAMGAPGEQGLQHGLRFGRAASTIDASNAAMESVGRAYSSDIDSVRPNPFIDLVSGLGMAYGGYQLAGAAGAAAGNAATDASANFGQGYEDASGNLCNPNVTSRQQVEQDARIRRQMQMQRAFGQYEATRSGSGIWGQ